MFLMRVGNDVRRRGIPSVFSDGKRAESLITGTRLGRILNQIFFFGVGGGLRGAAAAAASAATARAAAPLCPAQVGWVSVGLAEGKASGFSSEERVGLGQAWGVAGRSQ